MQAGLADICLFDFPVWCESKPTNAAEKYLSICDGKHRRFEQSDDQMKNADPSPRFHVFAFTRWVDFELQIPSFRQIMTNLSDSVFSISAQPQIVIICSFETLLQTLLAGCYEDSCYRLINQQIERGININFTETYT